MFALSVGSSSDVTFYCSMHDSCLGADCVASCEKLLMSEESISADSSHNYIVSVEPESHLLEGRGFPDTRTSGK